MQQYKSDIAKTAVANCGQLTTWWGMVGVLVKFVVWKPEEKVAVSSVNDVYHHNFQIVSGQTRLTTNETNGVEKPETKLLRATFRSHMVSNWTVGARSPQHSQRLQTGWEQNLRNTNERERIMSVLCCWPVAFRCWTGEVTEVTWPS